MAIEVFNRYEHKYLLSDIQYRQIIHVIDKYMELDAYNRNHQCYTIANLYYDTQDDYLIRRSLTSPPYKEKLRLRAYGVPSGDDKVFLEIKKKYRGLVNKRRTALSPKEAYAFAKTGEKPAYAPYMNAQVLREIAYFLSCYALTPKVYIAYDRMAYFEKNNPDLRISFDCNIRARRSALTLEAGDYGEPLLEPGIWLMEIKTAKTKPLWLTDLLAKLGLSRSSFSKYGTEFCQLLKPSLKPKQAGTAQAIS